jgi:hypothetical protein
MGERRSRRAERGLQLLLFALCGVALLPRPARAGAWVREPGHTFAKLGFNYSSSQDQLASVANLTRETATYALFAEVGLPWQMDVLVYLPYVVAANDYRYEARYVNHTFGDAHVQLDRAVTSKAALSVALDLKVPLYRSLYSGGSSGFVEVDHKLVAIASFPDVGNGVVELTPKVLYGKGFTTFYSRPGWVTAELGFRIRFAGLGHGLYLSAGAGTWVWPDHLALALFTSGLVDFATPRSVTLPDGRPALGSLYVAGGFIFTLAPFAPWLKLLASGGGLAISTDGRTGFDVDVGLAVEY